MISTVEGNGFPEARQFLWRGSRVVVLHFL
jgi:hypothetical protein